MTRPYIILSVTILLAACNSKFSAAVDSTRRGAPNGAEVNPPSEEETASEKPFVPPATSPIADDDLPELMFTALPPWTSEQDIPLQWQSIGKDFTYKIAIAKVDDCSQQVGETTTTKGTTAVISGLADGRYYVCITAISASGKKRLPTSPPVLNIDRTPPQPPGDPTSIQVGSPNQRDLRLEWASAPIDDLSGISKQEVLVFAADNTTCSGEADVTSEVAVDATEAVIDRMAEALSGVLRFRLRATNGAASTSESECSDTLNLRNGRVSFVGKETGIKVGEAVQYVDVNADGFDDVVSVNSAYDSNRGSVSIILGGPTLGSADPIIYSGDNQSDFFGGTLTVHDITGDGVPEIISTGLQLVIIPGRTTLAPSGKVATAGGHFYTDDGKGFGYSVAYQDMNGDGYDELFFIDAGANIGLIPAAGTMLVFPGAAALPASGTVAAVARRYDGDVEDQGVGHLPVFEDITGDGLPEMFSGYYRAEPNGDFKAGTINVLPGGPLPPSGVFATVARRYDGNAADELTARFRFCDLTGDGVKEYITYTTDAINDKGSIFVLESAGSALPASGNIDGVARRYDGDFAGDLLGSKLNGATSGVSCDDWTGDGIADLLSVASESVFLLKGAAVLPASGAISTAGIRITGPASSGFGYSVIHADVTGDGSPEIIVGAPSAEPANIANAGSVFFFAPNDLIASGTATALAHRTYDGDYIGDNLGGTVSGTISTADFNGDNFNDIIFASPTAAPSGAVDAGSVMVVLGAASLPASAAISTAGHRWNGAAGDKLCSDGSQLIDMTGDGQAEIACSHHAASPGGLTKAGSLWILSSHDGIPAAGPIDAVARRYNGTEAYDILSLAGLSSASDLDGDASGDTHGYFSNTRDLNGDNKQDLVFGSYHDLSGTPSGKVRILLGSYPLPASGPVSGAARIYTADHFKMIYSTPLYLDLNGDGIDELILTHDGSILSSIATVCKVAVLSGPALPPSGTLNSIGAYFEYDQDAATLVTSLPTLHDFNNDGYLDLGYKGYSPSDDIVTLFGAANIDDITLRTVAGQTLGDGDGFAQGSAYHDFTGDGVLDLIRSDAAADSDGLTDNGSIIIVPSPFL